MVRAGLKAIYLSGWQVAADDNTAGQMYPDQSLYPADSVPNVVRRINRALQRADQIEHAEGKMNHHWFAPIVADAEAGFGGPLNAFELMKSMIEAGAAAVHFEDQLSSEKKCGHLGGKVLIPTSHFIRTLVAARLAADVCGVPALVIARTDANSAKLLTSDVDPRDRAFCTGPRTAEGYFRITGGLDMAIARGLAYAPYADLLWCETSTPDLDEARRFAEAIHAQLPGQAAGLQLLAVVQLAAAPARGDHRPLPAGAGGHGLQVPVRHPGGLPRPEPRHVRAGARLPGPGHGRLLRAAGARVRRRAPTATPPPATSARWAPATSIRWPRSSRAARRPPWPWRSPPRPNSSRRAANAPACPPRNSARTPRPDGASWRHAQEPRIRPGGGPGRRPAVRAAVRARGALQRSEDCPPGCCSI